MTTTNRDFIIVVGLGLCVGIIAIALMATVDVITSLPPDIIEQHKPIARAGEWVTHPDGFRVCRLTRNIYYRQVLEPSDCTDWREPIPFHGQIVDFLSQERGGKINIEGEWRP